MNQDEKARLIAERLSTKEGRLRLWEESTYGPVQLRRLVGPSIPLVELLPEGCVVIEEER